MILRRTFGLAAAAATGALAVLAVARLALADGQMEPIRLVVHTSGPPECAPNEDFLDAVKLRTPRVRAAAAGEAARTFRVEITRKKNAGAKPIFGQLIVQEADGVRSETRVIRGETCAEVESALELITALAIDPDAQLHPRDHDAAAPDGDGEAGEDETAESGDAAPPARAVPTATEPDAATDADGLLTLKTPLAVPSRPWSWAAGFGLDLVASGQSPISIGGRVLGSVTAPDDGIVTPSFRLALAYFATSTPDVQDASATFRWFTAQLDACPVRFPVAELVRFSPCASLEGGFVNASSVGTTGFDHANRPWFSAGAIGRIAVDAVDPLILELWGGARLPFLRENFTFDETVSVYRAPPVLATGGIDVAVRFP